MNVSAGHKWQQLNDFPGLYVALRKKEKRLCSDEELKMLPSTHKNHLYHREWDLRKKNVERLKRYLLRKKTSLSILEIGCGNGWLSNQLSGLTQTSVIATDINATELEQALRVFGHKNNLRFLNRDILSDPLPGQRFDIILFAASIQYFRDAAGVIRRAGNMLAPQGEIHIMDSIFYPASELEGAQARSASYFESLGFSAMREAYFHHDLNLLKNFNYRVLFHPGNLLNRLFMKDPFYWIMIRE